MTLGFIGLGSMGQPMALRLIDAGYSLTVYDVRPEAIEPLRTRGARAVGSPAEVASVVKTVLINLPTPSIVREVALGPDGIFAGTKVKTLLDMSTTGARMAREIASTLSTKNITAVDAPVSGGVAGARKGTLAVMVACPQGQFSELESILKHIGKVFFIGERPGMGQTMKLVNNLLSATALAATSEAIVYGIKAGQDPAVMIDVLNASSGRSSASQDKFPRAILPRTFDYGFTTHLMCKDLDLCLDEAKEAGVRMQVADAVRKLWLQVQEEIGPDEDFTTIMKMIEHQAGIEGKSS